MALEGAGGTALGSGPVEQDDPFHAANGYHRIALDVMKALSGEEYQRVIVNTRNAGAIKGSPHRISLRYPVKSDETPLFRSPAALFPRKCGA